MTGQPPLISMPWSSTPNTAVSQAAALPLAHRVRENVLDAILSGEYAPGERITEPELAERLKVSRVPVREALKELETAGLLESRKHTGVFVRRLSTKETGDLYVLRSLLEAHTCTVAAANPNPVLLSRLEDLLTAMDSAAASQELSAYYSGNIAFHWEIVLACGNDQICETYQGLVQKLHLARLTNLSSLGGMQHSQSEHLEILNAMRNAQQELVGHLASKHVLTAKNRLFDQQTSVGD